LDEVRRNSGRFSLDSLTMLWQRLQLLPKLSELHVADTSLTHHQQTSWRPPSATYGACKLWVWCCGTTAAQPLLQQQRLLG
jgi:hypothetical protein